MEGIGMNIWRWTFLRRWCVIFLFGVTWNRKCIPTISRNAWRSPGKNSKSFCNSERLVKNNICSIHKLKPCSFKLPILVGLRKVQFPRSENAAFILWELSTKGTVKNYWWHIKRCQEGRGAINQRLHGNILKIRVSVELRKSLTFILFHDSP